MELKDREFFFLLTHLVIPFDTEELKERVAIEPMDAVLKILISFGFILLLHIQEPEIEYLYSK
jgi:hypothetical protein